MNITNLSSRPLKLEYTRIHRKYAGGLLLEEWQKSMHAADGNMPEEWVASTIEARTTDYIANEGLTIAELENGSREFLRDIIKSDPIRFLGEDHFKSYGTDTALLVKVIDSCNRLYLQVHPDREYAKKVFGSDFGKTEAWYILDGRKVNGQEPYILLGFKKGITKEIWKELFDRQDTAGMENALHRFSIKPGDIFFIESGTPHALGTGCFLLEVQEPTDYTMRVERTTPDGDRLPDSFCHQGAGFEKMLECFHYETYAREEILEKWYLKPKITEKQEGGIYTSIISPEYSPYFSMQKLDVSEKFHCRKKDTFSVAVVISGKGKLVWDDGEMEVKQADELFFPAALKDTVWYNNQKETLEIIFCDPPIK